MKFDVITLFPRQIKAFTEYGLFRIAQERTGVEINIHNLRNWADDKHGTVDDTPYGGGAGMVIKIEPVSAAIEQLRKKTTKVILPTPRGKTFTQKIARDFIPEKPDEDLHFIMLCGHYEGFDERVHMYLVDEELSVGDYVLSGGELPTLVIMDTLVRLIPGVLGNEESNKDESFENGFLEYPQYTRPESFMGWDVPKILLSGNHEEIKKWREKESENITKRNRPDLLNKEKTKT